MRFKRSQRVQELLLEEISKLLQGELKDPRIGFTTITNYIEEIHYVLVQTARALSPWLLTNFV